MYEKELRIRNDLIDVVGYGKPVINSFSSIISHGSLNECRMSLNWDPLYIDMDITADVLNPEECESRIVTIQQGSHCTPCHAVVRDFHSNQLLQWRELHMKYSFKRTGFVVRILK